METVSDSPRALPAAIRGWEQGVWCLAATVLAAGHADPSISAAAHEVLAACAAGAAAGQESGTRAVAAQFKASLLQAAALAGAERFAWLEQSDDALLAHGHANAQGAAPMVKYLLPGCTACLSTRR